MRNLKSFATVLLSIFIVALAEAPAQAQAPADQDFARITSTGSALRFDVRAENAGSTLVIAAPDGRIFRRAFKEGRSPEFSTADQKYKLPDGHYSYELRLTPVVSAEMKTLLDNGRGKDDEPEDVRATRKRIGPASLVQSGGFMIQNGSVVVTGQTEEQSLKSQSVPKNSGAPVQTNYVTKVRRHHLSPMLVPDQVIPDDLIVQGSICAGLDCVNNENFGFDTIRLKENNTRIQFDDTSVGAFPTNNWQIRANSSASGGQSFLGFVDQGASGNSETGTIVFEVDAGAPANSVRVSSDGRVGLRTAAPVLDLHINTSNTPAHRLEQNNGGGFTAQTWDIGANEANFFVRDVTSGSRLPLRIRPGAPTSSLDISAEGDVGIGTASPVFSNNAAAKFLTVDAGTGAFSEIGAGGNQSGTTAILGSLAFFNSNIVGAEKRNVVIAGTNDGAINSGVLQFFTFNAGTIGERMRINRLGQVGIGTPAPTDTLSVNGTASKPGGGSWSVFSDERLKIIKGEFNSGLKAVMQLQPLRYVYRPNNALDIKSQREHVGFGAQTLQKVIPEAVTSTDQGYLMVNNDPIIWTMLNAIKEQQLEIEKLRREVRQLRATSRRRR